MLLYEKCLYLPGVFSETSVLVLPLNGMLNGKFSIFYLSPFLAKPSMIFTESLLSFTTVRSLYFQYVFKKLIRFSRV
jgi:hypothetical protein